MVEPPEGDVVGDRRRKRGSKKPKKPDQNGNGGFNNIIIEIFDQEGGVIRATERTNKKTPEDYNYASFSSEVLNRAVSVVMDMGYNVNWDRVNRFVAHNNTTQNNSESVPSLDDHIARFMVHKMQKAYVCMKTNHE